MSVLKSVAYIPFTTLQSALEARHHSDYLSDFLNSDGHFRSWCLKQNLAQDEKAVIHAPLHLQQKWFKAYKEHSEGEAARPQVLDFLDTVYQEEDDGPFLYIGEPDNSSPQFVQTITQEILDLYAKEFPDGVVVIRMDE